ncbi:riboflavin biosynthesis protein RibF [Bacteroidales bacterium OttesenSCG-928-J19]|nr:riboflavin biosynthesis protein RibF [Bacteroidales bacterium OttesenSCG-928-J19]
MTKVIYWDNEPLPEVGLAASVGFFDGVHRGHHCLIEQLKEEAQLKILPTALITFSNHPRKVLNKEYRPELLTGTDERLKLLSQTGIDYLIVIPFTPAFSALSANEFIHEILCKQLHVQLLLIGHDHKFGKDRKENFDDYVRYGSLCDMKVIQAYRYEEGDDKFSSTRIRHYLKEGNVHKAAQLLSYNYTLEGIVQQGNQIGRNIGFPTANIRLSEPDKLIPQEGVYAVLVHWNGETYPGMLYIGQRPTVSSFGEKRIEVHLLNFNQDLYNESLQVEFVDFIRPGMRFSDLEHLQTQLKKDRDIIESGKWKSENEE